jgi:chemotaxis protein MotA
MFVIIGIIVVFGSVAGGYVMHHGNLLVLYQPSEFIIIGGAALGSLIIANPLHVLKAVMAGTLGSLKGSKYTKAFYLEQLKMLNEIFVYARKNGAAKLEADIDEPDKSPLFQNYPKFLSDHHALEFFCDTVRMSISGGVGPFELDQLMEFDMEAQHHEETVPVSSLSTVADALPGLGIVAAVLGVVITMGSLGGPPEEIGQKVAAALVGTFLGILMCYGLLGPVASLMTKQVQDRAEYMQFLRLGVLGFLKGLAPSLSVEFARRVIPMHVRPTFTETEASIKSGAAPQAQAKAA